MSTEEDGPELNRIWKAMMLAPDLELCEAMLGGQDVPIERLDGNWVLRFGLKVPVGTRRVNLNDFYDVPSAYTGQERMSDRA